MPLFAARQDFAGRDIERRKEIERAISDVIVRPPFRRADVHRQDRLGPLERLDLRLFVEGEHHRVVRRVHIQSDDISDFIHELGVGRDLEGARHVRFEAKGAPDPPHHRMTKPGFRGHRSRAPVGLALRRRLQRLDDHRFDRLVGDGPGGAHARLVIQAVESALDEARPPFTHGRIGGPMSTRHRGIRDRGCAREHKARPKREGAIDVGPLRQADQFASLGVRHDQGDFGTSDRGHIRK